MQSVVRSRIRWHRLAYHDSTRVSWPPYYGRLALRCAARALLPYHAIRIQGIATQASYLQPSLNLEGKHSSSVQPQVDDSILLRAVVHGIETWEQLAIEADLHRARNRGTRLVYDDSVRQDLDLWSVLLDYRCMKDGQTGIRDVLRSMLYDGEPVRLQSDAVSEHIWRTILPVVLKDEKLLYELCHTGSSFIRNRPLVFVDAVGHLLANDNLRLAIIVGTQLLSAHFRGHSDLLHLFDISMRISHPNAIQNYCQLLSRLPLHRIYPDVIPKLCAAGRLCDAFALHNHLLSLGDLPTQFEQIEPFVRELASNGSYIEPFVDHLESHEIAFSHQTRQLYTLEKAQFALQSNKSAKYILNQGPGSQPMKLSDTFVARTFATRSVSFDFVLTGLRFVGLFEIGPLAVREIALTAESITVLKQRFRKLEATNVDLGASNYVRVIRNLCLSDQDDLLQGILRSDMHYEVFEDVQKQKRLLTQYYQAKNWPEVNRTLAILNGGRIGRTADIHTTSLLLQTCLVLGEWRNALQLLDDLKQLTKGSVQRSKLAPLRLALKRIWANTAVEVRQDKDFLHRHRYLVGFMQLTHMAGLQAHPWQWRSVIHAVGRSGDWELSQNLMISMARAFKKHLPCDQDVEVDANPVENAIVDNVFDVNMQATIIELALVAECGSQNVEEAWFRGMRLLSRLNSSFGLQVDYHAILNAFKQRLAVIFNDPDSEVQRRFVVSHLRQFNWVWRECAMHEGREMPSNFAQLGFRKPDLTLLRLFQQRARLVHLRKEPIDARYIVSMGLEHLQDLDDSPEELQIMERDDDGTRATDSGDNLLQQASTFEDNATVFYEDLLHPSYTAPKKVSK